MIGAGKYNRFAAVLLLLQVVQVLVRRRADVNVCSGSGRTLRQVLLENHAQGRGQNVVERPRSRARRHNRSEVERLRLVEWVEASKQFTSGHWAVDTRSVSKLRQALRCDEVFLSDWDSATENGITPLSLARCHGAAALFYPSAWIKDGDRLEMVRLLQLALAPWSPEGHQVFPWRFRATTMIVLQVARRLQRQAAIVNGELCSNSDSHDSNNNETSLVAAAAAAAASCAPPLDFWLTVMSYCGRDDWRDVPESFFASSMARRATPLE